MYQKPFHAAATATDRPLLPHSSYSRVSWNVDPNSFFLPPTRRGLRKHPYKVLQGTSHRRRRGSAYSVRVVKYWNKPPASVVKAPSVNIFKKRLEKMWTEVFPLSTPLTEISSPQFPSPPPRTARHPLAVHICICCLSPCFVYMVSSGPFWPTFYHNKS